MQLFAVKTRIKTIVCFYQSNEPVPLNYSVKYWQNEGDQLGHDTRHLHGALSVIK